MRNKKSVLMTLNHNFGCFSGVGFGIAGNVSRLCVVVAFTEIYEPKCIAAFGSGRHVWAALLFERIDKTL
jgi:hypothetical protein